ncbi:hypothetical protein [Halocatena halophila]|uniref:hypothetical protein n=1 Tax=Halocatena halophila TaxID=2814576 RepID=UPI002ED6BB61
MGHTDDAIETHFDRDEHIGDSEPYLEFLEIQPDSSQRDGALVTVPQDTVQLTALGWLLWL